MSGYEINAPFRKKNMSHLQTKNIIAMQNICKCNVSSIHPYAHACVLPSEFLKCMPVTGLRKFVLLPDYARACWLPDKASAWWFPDNARTCSLPDYASACWLPDHETRVYVLVHGFVFTFIFAVNKNLFLAKISFGYKVQLHIFIWLKSKEIEWKYMYSINTVMNQQANVLSWRKSKLLVQC